MSPSSMASNGTEPPEHAVAINRQVWTDMNARYADARASAAWHKSDITWGVWQVPEADLQARCRLTWPGWMLWTSVVALRTFLRGSRDA